jgi:formylglycine-generating enzyme required for sulfatase activity
MKKMAAGILIIILTIVVLISMVFADTFDIIVAPMNTLNIDPNTKEYLMDIFLGELSQSKKYKFINAAVVYSSINASANDIKIAAKQKGANLALKSNIIKEGDTYLISGKIENISDGTLIISAKDSCRKCKSEDLANKLAILAQRLIAQKTAYPNSSFDSQARLNVKQYQKTYINTQKTKPLQESPPQVKIINSTLRDSQTGIDFILVKAGSYQAGDGSTKKVNNFYIGKYEVTQGQWKKIMNVNPSWFKNCGDNCPVEQVSWNDVQKFISTLNSKSSGKYRLPTGVEWEFVCRSGGKNETYSGGEDVERAAWYGDNSGKKTHPAGKKTSNGLGIYDMSGNVWEWTQDNYDRSSNLRVARGGSWYENAGYSRCVDRMASSQGLTDSGIGFRLMMAH